MDEQQLLLETPLSRETCPVYSYLLIVSFFLEEKKLQKVSKITMKLLITQNDPFIQMIYVKTFYLIYPNVKWKYYAKQFFFISGICLFLFKQYSLVDSYNCSHFESGCPNTSFVSYKLFERKSCRSGNTILFDWQNNSQIPLRFRGFLSATGSLFFMKWKNVIKCLICPLL